MSKTKWPTFWAGKRRLFLKENNKQKELDVVTKMQTAVANVRAKTDMSQCIKKNEFATEYNGKLLVGSHQ